MKTKSSLATPAFEIFQGSMKSQHFAPQVIKLLRQCIDAGEDVRFRDNENLCQAFEEKRCLYALSHEGQMVGFVYLEPMHLGEKACVERRSLAVHPAFRGAKLGKMLIENILQIAREMFPHLDLLSMTSNPIVATSNRYKDFENFSYQRLFDVYGIDSIEECESRPNLTYEVFDLSQPKKPLSCVKIYNVVTGHPLKAMILPPSSSSKNS